MTVRSVYIAKEVPPYYEEVSVEFDWFGGFALSQKRKSEIGLHQNFNARFPEIKVLEVSSSSTRKLGYLLSAMRLSKRTSLGVTSVESAFQSSRIYLDGNKEIGPYPEGLFLPGKECKKQVKIRSKGLHSYAAEFEGERVPTFGHGFYDYIYLNGLLEEENREVREQLLAGGYTAFTDLATKSLSCQARTCAIFVGLSKAGKLDQCKDYAFFREMFLVENEMKRSNRNVLWTVSRTFDREDAIHYYDRYCASLTNRKTDDNFLPEQE